ncbi:MAG TPA: RelA/SpoT domain-containing protein, partial [Candidatus Angelobacter sp.]
MGPSEKPKLRESIETVLDDFDAKKETLEAFCVRTKSLIEDCLTDANLRFQSIQARVKKRHKLRDKYLNPQKGYKKLDDITDQAALRVIVYYEDEIDRASELIKKEFNVLPELSVDKRQTAPDQFGYYALNFVC